MRFSKRRRIAASISHGTFVAPSTKRPSFAVATPCICTRTSVLMRRVASDSPSLLEPHILSISSMKIMARSTSLARVKSCFTSRSDSPCHLDTRSEEDTAKNWASASVATALARNDFPVPGGPYSKMPRHGFRFPTKSWGNLCGRITVSFRAALAPSKPATSLHLIFGFSVTMALDNCPRSLRASSSSPPFVESLSSRSFVKFVVDAEPPPAACVEGRARCSRTFFRSSARFMYPSTRCNTNSRAAGFFSYLTPVINTSNDRLYRPKARS
mmetsp:Transcript_15667/g.51284  ORF Transcript_15667/g.51284 Transcript_15667/m.51284 type:complete len:270 (-) Transcript_15667:160-969(-)